jgi:hypothetical protein
MLLPLSFRVDTARVAVINNSVTLLRYIIALDEISFHATGGQNSAFGPCDITYVVW